MPDRESEHDATKGEYEQADLPGAVCARAAISEAMSEAMSEAVSNASSSEVRVCRPQSTGHAGAHL